MIDKIKLKVLLLVGLVLTSCSNDDNSTSQANNPPEDPTVVAPNTYDFDRNGATSVSFGGQTTRIQMAEELVSGIKNPIKTEAELDAMYAHEEGNNDFMDANLNASNKNARSKTAASKDYFSANTTDAAVIKAVFDSYIANQVSEVFPNWSATASAGNAGQLQEAGGGATRYINAKGLEYDQAFTKSLIGALMVDQMLNNYLSPAVLDEGNNIANNNENVLDAGKNYTTMEHKWDEAYGYLYGNEANPAVPGLGADSFLNKYVSRVENDTDFSGIAMTIYNAFKLGRAAIVAKDYTLRDAQAQIIREKVSEIIGIRAVYYLQQAKATLANDKADAFHALSEGYGFIYSLQFTRKPGTNGPYFTKLEAENIIERLMTGNGFWDVLPETLDELSSDISARFSFTTEQAGS